MGIQNLLRFLSNSTRDAHISEFENEFVAVDAYCWLHKGVYSCAFELAMKKPTVKYVTYCMRYIEMLLHFKVKPILVFDGRRLSSKSETEKKRREERKRKYDKGKELMRAGKTIDGRKLLAESVDVTHELALNLMKECRQKNVDCIVAPYEADAQLAFFSLNKVVKCIITEDSDLLVYGCDRVMFKMDTSGRGKLIEKKEIHFSLNMTPDEFNEDMFRHMCILTGCDYLPSLPSIGPVFALKFIKMLRGNDIYDALPKLPIYTNKMNIKVTDEYIVGFKIADKTFKHQLVYDPFLRLQVPLRPVENDDDIVGTKLPEDLAFHLAVGNIDPITMKKVDNFDPDKVGTGFTILWKTDLLPNAIPRQFHVNYNHPLNESKKRQRENQESDAVNLMTNNIKKYCTPPSSNSLKGYAARNAAEIVPKNSFIFSPKVQNRNKTVSKVVDESKFLKSRYFPREKDDRKDKKLIESWNDKRKDETYDDYLQRLLNEYFPVDENEKEDSETTKDNYISEPGNSVLKEFCTCKKSMSCSCFNNNSEVYENLKLDECIRNLRELKENREKFNLLDEIHKNQSKIFGIEELVKENEIQEESSEINSGKKSPNRTFTVNLTNVFSKFDSVEMKNTEGQFETDVAEKELSRVNSDHDLTIVSNKDQESKRSPSPVFKVQKQMKVLKKNFKYENTSDTASTDTSVYFSLGGIVNGSNSQVSTSARKKPGKNNAKNSSANKTLFQFGFKKQRPSGNDSKG